MIGDRKALGQLLTALLIGLAGVAGALVSLSRAASASPMLNGASLSIAKSQNADIVEVGEQLVYTLTYHNTSTETVTGIFITDTLDPNVSYVTASLTPSGGLPDAPFWSIGPLSDSVSGTIVLTTTVASPLPNGTLLTNTATIDSDEAAPATTTVTTTVAAPALELTKSDDPDPAPAGGPLTYTLTYSNA
ncbi:MAG: DUF11 domain-containing protein, partial [Anaerolineae bacterium]|nr:DUF11 domain-containing protein [Anaerolineae bacterium]